MSLRKRIEKSPALTGALGTLITRYLALCDRSTRWQIEGRESLEAALAEGPVLTLMWHSRMAMGPGTGRMPSPPPRACITGPRWAGSRG